MYILINENFLGSSYYVRVLSILNKEALTPNASLALHKYSNAIVEILPPETDSSVHILLPNEKPDVYYEDIGGLDMQKQEIREAVELPLVQGELYKQANFLIKLFKKNFVQNYFI